MWIVFLDPLLCPTLSTPRSIGCTQGWLSYFKVLQAPFLLWVDSVESSSLHALAPPSDTQGEKRKRPKVIQPASYHPQEPCLFKGGLVILPELNWWGLVSYYSIQLGLGKTQDILLWSKSSDVAHLPTSHPSLVLWITPTVFCVVVEH